MTEFDRLKAQKDAIVQREQSEVSAKLRRYEWLEKMWGDDENTSDLRVSYWRDKQNLGGGEWVDLCPLVTLDAAIDKAMEAQS